METLWKKESKEIAIEKKENYKLFVPEYNCRSEMRIYPLADYTKYN